jgi:anthranilate synthase component 1
MRAGSYTPDFKQFCALAKEGNLIPVFREVLADFETPVSAFAKIDEGPCAYLFESVEGGEKWGRYSFLGSGSPMMVQGSSTRLVLSDGRRRRGIPITRDVLTELREIMAEYRPVPVAGLPRFYGGAVGYLSYDVVRQFERLPSLGKDLLGLPDISFLLTDTLLIFDNVAHTIKVVANARIASGGTK